MRLIFFYNFGNQIEFDKKQIKWASDPEFKDEIDIYLVQIMRLSSIELEFVYFENISDPFISFLKNHKDDIESVLIKKDSGELIFDGIIEENSIKLNRRDHTIKLSFINQFESILDQEISYPDGFETACYPTYQEWNNGTGGEPGDGALKELLVLFRNHFFPSYELEMPENWYVSQPIRNVYENYQGNYGKIGYKLYLNPYGKKVIDILKIFSLAGNCVIKIGYNKIKIVENNPVLDNSYVYCDKLFEVSYSNQEVERKEIDESIFENDSNYGSAYYAVFGIAIQTQIMTYAPIDLKDYLIEFYQNQSNYAEYGQFGFDGRAKIECGDNFKVMNNRFLAKTIKKSGKFIDYSFEIPVQIEAVKVQ